MEDRPWMGVFFFPGPSPHSLFSPPALPASPPLGGEQFSLPHALPDMICLTIGPKVSKPIMDQNL